MTAASREVVTIYVKGGTGDSDSGIRYGWSVYGKKAGVEVSATSTTFRWKTFGGAERAAERWCAARKYYGILG